MKRWRQEKPLVAFAVGGLKEVVDHGNNGLLVTPADPLALAGGLEEVLKDPERAASLGANGRAKFVREFTARSHIERLLLTYSEMLSRARKSKSANPSVSI